MKSVNAPAFVLVAIVAAACSGVTGSPTASVGESALASPSIAEPTATASPPATNPLIGRWTTGPTTCADQNAALQAAGITAEQMALGGWSPTCADTDGAEFIIYFSSYRLVQFQDGDEAWDGEYRIVDEDTFEAGDGNHGYYVTYRYAIEGDQLTIDMVKEDCPWCTPAVLAGEVIAGTVIYETSTFTLMR